MPACLRADRLRHPGHDAARRPAPKPVGGYTETILRVIDVVFGAFAKAAPERAMAQPVRHHQRAVARRLARRNGQRWVMFCFFGGGLGGNPEGDGLNHGNNPISTATIPPVEILEAAYPVMFTQWALRPDSAGAGQHRGGLGAIYEIELLADGGADVFLLGERGKFPPFGVDGGGPAALNRFVYDNRSRRTPRRRSSRRSPTSRSRQGQTRAAGDAGRRRLRRSADARSASASRATCGSAMSRASGARDYGVVLATTVARCRRHRMGARRT